MFTVWFVEDSPQNIFEPSPKQLSSKYDIRVWLSVNLYKLCLCVNYCVVSDILERTRRCLEYDASTDEGIMLSL